MPNNKEKGLKTIVEKLRNYERVNVKKLDQKTLLCQAHLDDLKDNIWTILDHLTIFDHYEKCWIILYHLRPTLTI